MLGGILFLAAMQIPVPTGVNDAVLGDAEAFKVEGPARICFLSSGFDLRRGETSYLSYLGIHSAAVKIMAKEGSFEIRVGSWRRPKLRGRFVTEVAGGKVFRYRRGGKPRYLLRDAEGWPRAWLEGDAFKDDASDRSVLRRLTLALEDGKPCARTFAYGWDFEEAQETPPAAQEEPR